MRNRLVFEDAKHVNEGVHVSQGGEKRGFLQRLLPDRRDIGILNGREYCLLWLIKRGELVESLVWNLCDTEVRLTGIRIPAIFYFGLGEDLEQGGLSHLRQADNSSLHSLSCVES